MLIVLPTTAPFQTVTLAELFGVTIHAAPVTESDMTVTSVTRGTEVSTLPATDGAEGRIEVESRSPNTIAWRDSRQNLFEEPHVFIIPPVTQATPILRI